MPTEKPRFTITLDDDTYKEIDDFQFRNHYPTLPNTAKHCILLRNIAVLCTSLPNFTRLTVSKQYQKKKADFSALDFRLHIAFNFAFCLFNACFVTVFVNR